MEDEFQISTQHCFPPPRPIGYGFRRYSSGMFYYAPWGWFPNAAKDLLEWLTDPIGRTEHQKLYNEIVEGDDLEGFLHFKPSDEASDNFQYILGFLCFVGMLITFAVCKFWNRGGQIVEISGEKWARAKKLPVLLASTAVFICMGLLLAIFSMNLWTVYKSFNDWNDSTEYNMKLVKYDVDEIIKRGKCENQAFMEDGVTELKEKITAITKSISTGCERDGFIANHLMTMRHDQEAVDLALISTSELLQQLNQLALNDSSSSVVPGLELLLKAVKVELEEGIKKFGMLITESSNLKAQALAHMKGLDGEIEKVNQPLFKSLDDMRQPIKEVVDSLNSALMDTTKWITTVGQRMLKMREFVRKQGDPLISFLMIQSLVGIPVLITMGAIGAGFLVLIIRIVYPKALILYPVARNSFRRCIFAVACVQFVLALLVCICATSALNNAVLMTNVCKPMYIRNYYNDYIGDFYKDIHVGVNFTDYHGQTTERLFSEIVFDSKRDRNFASPGDHNLLPSLKNEVYFESWKEHLEVIETNNSVDKVHFEDNTKIVKRLELKLGEFNDMETHFEGDSHLSLAVNLQIKALKRQLNSLSFDSLKESTSTQCQPESSAILQRKITRLFENVIGIYERRFTQFLYSFGSAPRTFYNTYMMTGETMCVLWRIPASGIWLSGDLLVILLLVSKILLFMTSRYLNVKLVDDEHAGQERSPHFTSLKTKRR